MSEFAPIVLIVYGRPDHTRRTLDALSANSIAGYSDLFIFSDGPKYPSDQGRVSEVRSILEGVQGFKTVTVQLRSQNMGLSANIIGGVSAVLSKYGRAIVVEDDILTSPHFLSYMNNGLAIYQDHASVFSITGYTPPISIPDTYSSPVYWAPRGCSWGWGTWADRWNQVDWDLSSLKSSGLSRAARAAYDAGGNDLSQLIIQQIQGRINSWDIPWSYSHAAHDAGCIYPVRALVQNIGTDGSGTHHTTISHRYDTILDANVPPQLPTEVPPNPLVMKQFKLFFDVPIRTQIKRWIVQTLRRFHLYPSG
ncbi:sugar transferase [bacterium]|nr:sugar transferase [bacterium]